MAEEYSMGLPASLVAVSKESCNARDPDLIPGSVRSLGEGNGYPHQYTCLGNPMDRGLWWAAVHHFVRVGARVGHDLVTKAPPIFHCI